MGKLNGSGSCRGAFSPDHAVAALTHGALAQVALEGRVEPSTDAQLEAELREFLAGRSNWPAAHRFLDEGRGDLLHAMDHSGGRRYWWERLGSLPRERSLISLEDRERVLRHFLNGRPDWPCHDEFVQARLAGTLGGSTRNGLTARQWRERLGYSAQDLRRRWTTERIDEELTAFVSGRDEWPTQREFRDAGLKGLLEAIHRDGGAEHWASRFGMTTRPHGRDGGKRRRRKRQQEARQRKQQAQHRARQAAQQREQRIHQELTELLEGRTTWPTTKEFEDTGNRRLLDRIYRNGGAAHWASQFGMTPHLPGRRRRSPAS